MVAVDIKNPVKDSPSQRPINRQNACAARVGRRGGQQNTHWRNAMNWMKSTIYGVGMIAAGLSIGCYAQPRLTDSEGGSSPMDITPPSLASSSAGSSSLHSYEPAPAIQPAPTPVAPEPIVSSTPAPAVTSTPVSSSGSHVVKKGDTLYGIARKHYGDGKQWTKIASANPGVSPQSLRVGQTLVVP